MNMPSETTGIIQALRDAPVMNLFVLVGFMLVVLAAVGHKWNLDVGGRVLSGICGLGLLGAATAMFLGVAKARSTSPEDLTPAHGGILGTPKPGVASALAPAPPPFTGSEAAPAASKPSTLAVPKVAPRITTRAATPPPVIQLPPPPMPAAILAGTAPKRSQTLAPKDVYGDWGCEETKTVSTSLVLPDGAEFLSAAVDAVRVDKAKSFQRLPPSFDPATRTVSGSVEFRGLDRVFFNCPGGGHGTVRLTVTAAVRAGGP
jgi:hypothetical protein